LLGHMWHVRRHGEIANGFEAGILSSLKCGILIADIP